MFSFPRPEKYVYTSKQWECTTYSLYYTECYRCIVGIFVQPPFHDGFCVVLEISCPPDYRRIQSFDIGGIEKLCVHGCCCRRFQVYWSKPRHFTLFVYQSWKIGLRNIPFRSVPFGLMRSEWFVLFRKRLLCSQSPCLQPRRICENDCRMTSFVSKTLKRTQRHDLSRDGSSTSVVDCQVHGTTCRLLCSFLECLFLLGKDFGAYFSWDIGIALCSARGHRTKNQTCWYRFTTSHCEYEGIPSKPKNPNVESNRWILIRREFLLLGLMILDTYLIQAFFWPSLGREMRQDFILVARSSFSKIPIGCHKLESWFALEKLKKNRNLQNTGINRSRNQKAWNLVTAACDVQAATLKLSHTS